MKDQNDDLINLPFMFLLHDQHVVLTVLLILSLCVSYWIRLLNKRERTFVRHTSRTDDSQKEDITIG
jgi:hypothetical protein